MKALASLTVNAVILGVIGVKSLYTVQPGHKAFKFNKISGVGMTTYKEGLHFRIPMLERPIIYNVRATPSTFSSSSCNSKDLQKVTLKLRVLYKPQEDQL